MKQLCFAEILEMYLYISFFLILYILMLISPGISPFNLGVWSLKLPDMQIILFI